MLPPPHCNPGLGASKMPALLRPPWPQWSGPWPPAHSSACTGMPCHLHHIHSHSVILRRAWARPELGACLACTGRAAVGKLVAACSGDIARCSGASSLGIGHCSWAAGGPGQGRQECCPRAGRTAQEGRGGIWVEKRVRAGLERCATAHHPRHPHRPGSLEA